VIPQSLNFIYRRFGTLYSIFIGGVNTKNNRDEIVGVFIWEQVWLNNKYPNNLISVLPAYTAYKDGTGKVFRNVGI